MLVFVLTRGVQEFQAVGIADLKSRHGPKTGCGVGPNGDIVDEHLQECAIPSIAVAVVHGWGGMCSIGLRQAPNARLHLQGKAEINAIFCTSNNSGSKTGPKMSGASPELCSSGSLSVSSDIYPMTHGGYNPENH